MRDRILIHVQTFSVEYYDVRAAASAFQALNGRPLFGARLHIVRTKDVQLPRLSPTQPSDDRFGGAPFQFFNSFRAPISFTSDMQDARTKQDESVFSRTVEGAFTELLYTAC